VEEEEQVCESNDYDACVGVDISYQLTVGDIRPVHSIHAPCDAFDSGEDLELTIIDAVMEDTFNVYGESDYTDYINDIDWQVTCCRIS
jgi:hypothetical protein